jgi:hypothetical protein
MRRRIRKSSNVMSFSFESLMPPETVSPETAYQASCIGKQISISLL